MTESPDEFMTVAAVAAILKLNQQTVRNWIDAGKLPALHIGRRVRVRGSDFVQLIASGYGRGTAPTTGADQPTPASIWDGQIPPPQVP